MIRGVLRHDDGEERDRERDADPEAARHVREFWIYRVRHRRRHRLQRHAADRAASRSVAHDLGMHWARPQRPGYARARVGRGHPVPRMIAIGVVMVTVTT